MPYTPDSQAVSQILGKIDAMLAQLSATSAHTAQLAQMKKTLADLHTTKAGQTVADLPMKDGTVVSADWAGKSESDRQATWKTLSTIHDELRTLNTVSLSCGKCYLTIFSALLVLVVLLYLCTHRQDIKQKIQAIPSQKSVETLKQARVIELKLAALKEKQSRKLSEKPTSTAPVAEKPGAHLTTTGKAAHATLSPPSQSPSIEQGIADDKKSLADSWPPFKNNLYEISLPYETLRLLGTASAELEAEDLTIHVTYQQLLKHLHADLESLSTTYFWTNYPWRWLELSLWATMGCLVGLLFYIVGLLKQGVFLPEEIPMFGAELLMAPIVVPVVFFLFNLSGISEFTPSQSSITMNIGVAFILGFAIRRTIGIIDLI